MKTKEFCSRAMLAFVIGAIYIGIAWAATEQWSVLFSPKFLLIPVRECRSALGKPAIPHVRLLPTVSASRRPPPERRWSPSCA